VGHPTIPEPQNQDWFPEADWIKRHESLGRHNGTEQIDIVFLGDSISEGWLGEGKTVWDKHYAPRKAVTLGIGGDETQHILWRLDHGAVDELNPKVVILLIGTNNIGNSGHGAEPTGAGIKLIVEQLRAKLPNAAILLLGVFPRDAMPDTGWRKDIRQINSAISQLHDGKHIWYLDIGDSFLTPDGKIPPAIMPDALHLSTQGYEIWANAMEPLLSRLVGA
jgi:beta-glucosidase